MDIKVIVATHKPYKMPEDKMYLPVHAGRGISEGWQESGLAAYTGDNTGENISEKNKNYCELTALYWAWKNLDCDYLGLAHYRRHFKGSKGDKWQSILDSVKAQHIFADYPVILPNKRDYFIESTYNQYIHAHNKQDLDVTLDIIKEFYPEYLEAWHKVMKSTSGHRFNMFIMRKDIMDSYCKWVFDILFRLESRLDISGYSPNDRRVFGFVSERLLDVWLMTNNISYKELPVVNMEKQNWLKKGANFLRRKFIGKK